MKYTVKTNNMFLADLEKYAGITTDDANEVAQYIIENSSSDLKKEYDEMLDECYGEIEIAGYSYYASIALYRVDEIAYRCGENDYESSREEDIAYDIARMDDGEEETYYGYTVYAVEEDEEEEKE